MLRVLLLGGLIQACQFAQASRAQVGKVRRVLLPHPIRLGLYSTLVKAQAYTEHLWATIRRPHAGSYHVAGSGGCRAANVPPLAYKKTHRPIHSASGQQLVGA